MKFIVQTCSGREWMAEEIKKQLPEVIVNYDTFTDPSPFLSTAFKNYIKGWSLAGEEACVQMDDDTILCDDFKAKVMTAINQYPDHLIQFFSMRKKDLTEGTRFELGSNFMMQQCYYLPKGLSKQIAREATSFLKRPDIYKTDRHCPSDKAVQEVLKRNKMKYVVWIPNLVDHRVATSAIDSRRSSKRQSKTFAK